MFSHLVWQPIFDRKGKIGKVEVLSRTASGAPPDIDWLEGRNEIHRYDLQVAESSLGLWHALQGVSDVPPVVSLNISPNSFCSYGLMVDRLLEVTSSQGVEPQSVAIEILETALFDSRCWEPLKEAVQALRQEGFSVVLDDFGRRSASLDRLIDLEFSGIKLDGFFVQKLLSSKRNKAQSIVRNIVRMAHDLGLGVTAEYVETADQLTFLYDVGVDFFQGYWLSPALATDQFLRLLSLSPLYSMPKGEACRLAKSSDISLSFSSLNLLRSTCSSLRRFS